MSLPLLALILLAAVFHASWNALFKASGNPLALAARAVMFGALVCLPFVLAIWLWQGHQALSPEGWGLAFVSGVIELAYFIALSTAYQRGELSAVYPIARGTAPLLAVVIGLAILGERLSLPALLGVVCLMLGIWLVRRPSPAGSALVPAVLTGVMIAAYSAVDRVGVRLGSPWLYGEALWLFEAVLLFAYARIMRVGALESAQPRTFLVVGALMTSAYFMILYAFSVAPLSIVAPLRESAIVLVTAWGIWRLRERRGARLRVVGALAIVAGIGLVALAGP